MVVVPDIVVGARHAGQKKKKKKKDIQCFVDARGQRKMTRQLQLTRPHQNYFLLQHLDHRVKIWHNQHESMDQSCIVFMIQTASGGGVMVWGSSLYLNGLHSDLIPIQ